MKLHRHIIIMAIFFASLCNLEAAKSSTKDIMPSDLGLVFNEDRNDFIKAMGDYVSYIFILEHIASTKPSEYINSNQMGKLMGKLLDEFLDDNKDFNENVVRFVEVSGNHLLGFELKGAARVYVVAEKTLDAVKNTPGLLNGKLNEKSIMKMMAIINRAKEGIFGKTIDAFVIIYEDIQAASKDDSNWEDYATHTDIL